MTFMHELVPHSLEIDRMCKYALPMSRLSKVIVRQTDRQTDRMTDTTEIIHHAASRVAKDQNHNELVSKIIGKLEHGKVQDMYRTLALLSSSNFSHFSKRFLTDYVDFACSRWIQT